MSPPMTPIQVACTVRLHARASSERDLSTLERGFLEALLSARQGLGVWLAVWGLGLTVLPCHKVVLTPSFANCVEESWLCLRIFWRPDKSRTWAPYT